MSPTNTQTHASQTAMLAEMLCGGSAGAIERQEARGQQELVAADVLPTQGLKELRTPLERNGGSIGQPVAGDPIFTNVTLPTGWSKQSTDHSMWSRLVDQAGHERAAIFYKAAFYDRDAFIRPTRRFSIDAYGHEIENEVKVSLRDARQEIQRETQIVKVADRDEAYRVREQLELSIRNWLDQNYPQWKDPAAYWD